MLYFIHCFSICQLNLMLWLINYLLQLQVYVCAQATVTNPLCRTSYLGGNKTLFNLLQSHPSGWDSYFLLVVCYISVFSYVLNVFIETFMLK